MAFFRKRVAFHKFDINILVLLGFILFPLHLNAQSRSAANEGSIEVQRNPTYLNYTPQQLVEEIFVKKGGCASVSNVRYTGHGWNGNRWVSTENRGLGYFHKGSSIFTMEEGLILTTGKINTLEGPNSKSDGCLPIDPKVITTDPDLQSIVSSGSGITNIAVLEFDFVPSTSKVTFRYRFGSEEYPQWAGTSWNDVFGFFISGPGISGKKNIALLPDNTSVSINNVNDGNRTYSWQNCPRAYNHPDYISNPQLAPKNKDLYVSVPAGWSSVNCSTTPAMMGEVAVATYKATELNGLTVVLEATADVIPCNTYHIKLAIANVHRAESVNSDFEKQSAVFLQANSFDIGGHITNYGNGIENMDLLYKGCDNNYFRFSRANADNSELSIDFTYEGTAVNGVDITTLDGQPLPGRVTIPANELYTDVYYKVPNTSSGAKYLDLDIVLNCPCSSDKVKKRLWIYDSTPEDDYNVRGISSCVGTNNNKIQASATGGSGHHQASLDGQSWYSLPYTFENLAVGDHTVNLRDSIGCMVHAKTVSVGSMVVDVGEDQASCTNTFTMNAPPLNPGETGRWTVASGTANISDPASPTTAVTVTSGPAKLKWTLTTPDCTFEGEVALTLIEPPRLSSGNLVDVCSGESFTYTAQSTISPTTFSWVRADIAGISNPASNGSTNVINEALINTTAEEINVPYIFTLTANGCTVSETVHMTVHPKPTLQGIPASSVCSGTEYSYPVSFNIDGTSIEGWSRDAVTGIEPVTGSGTTGSIKEVLVNATSQPIDVTYKITFVYFGCRFTDDIVVTVKPVPKLNNTPLSNPVCSGAEFEYTITSNMDHYPDVAYSWSRSDNTNIAEPASSGNTAQIKETLTNKSNSSSTYASYSIQVSADGCTTSGSVQPEISANLVLNAPTEPLTVCSGSMFSFTGTSSAPGVSLSWQREAVAGIAEAAGSSSSGTINEVLTNTTNSPIDVKYTYTLTDNNSCTGTDFVFVTVTPKPKLGGSRLTQICSGVLFSYDAVLDVPGATITGWERAAVDQITPTTGSGNTSIIEETLISTALQPVDVKYKVFIENGDCSYTEEFILTVYPIPVVTNIPTSSFVICTGEEFTFEAQTNDPNVIVRWKRNRHPSITPAPYYDMQEGMIKETLTNTSSFPVEVSYSLYFKAGTSQCTSYSAAIPEVKVIVNPTPTLAGTRIGSCSGALIDYTPTSAPLNADCVWERIAVDGIEEPAATGTGGIKETLTNTTDQSIEVTYMFTLTANGCTNVQPFYVTVHPRENLKLSSPTMLPLICSGTTFTYEPTSNTPNVYFEWQRNLSSNINSGGGYTRPTPGSISEELMSNVPDSGDEGIPYATYVYTLSLSGCKNTEKVKVPVYPYPKISNSTPFDTKICSGHYFRFNPIIKLNDVDVTLERIYSPDEVRIDISPDVSSPNIDDDLHNLTAKPVEVIYRYTLKSNTCPFEKIEEHKVIVRPWAMVTNIPDDPINHCNKEVFEFDPEGNVDGATFPWERLHVENIEPRPTPFATGTGKGTGKISEPLTNTSKAPIEVTYTITPKVEYCANPNPFYLKVLVNPTPEWTNIPSSPLAACSGEEFNFVPESDVTGAVFTWERQPAVNIEPAPGTSIVGNINERLVNTSTTPVEVTYRLTVATSTGCVNPTPYELKVAVNPQPLWDNPPAASISICSGDAFSYAPQSNLTGTTISWERQPNDKIEPTPSGSSIGAISEQLINTSSDPVDVTYKLTFTSSEGCINPVTSDLIVTVNPIPAITSALAHEMCSGSQVGYEIKTNVQNATFSWKREALAGIEEPESTGTSNVINEVLTYVGTGNDQKPQDAVYEVTVTSVGCVTTQNVTVKVKPLPRVFVYGGVRESFCSGKSFEIRPSSSVHATTQYEWKMPAVEHIEGGERNGSGDVRLTLTNTSTEKVPVSFFYTGTADGCVGSTWECKTAIDPYPNVLNPIDDFGLVCSGSKIFYEPDIDVEGAVFSWSRSSVPGLYQPSQSGKGKIDESLGNLSDTLIDVTYVCNIEARSCSLPLTRINVTLYPNKLSISNTPQSSIYICSNSIFHFEPLVKPADATVTVIREPIEGITATRIGDYDAAIINDLLVNKTNKNIKVTYTYKLESSLCPSANTTQAIIVTVEGAPQITNIDEAPKLHCSGTEYTFNPTYDYITGSTVAIEWERQPNAHIEGSSSGSGRGSIRETLTNKTDAPVQVSYKMKISRSGCADDYTLYDINVTVYPEPKWTQPSTPLDICSGEPFSFDPLKDMAPEFAGSTVTWERKPVDGIEPVPSATGSGSINEQLTNTGTTPVEVTYLLTFTTVDGCKNITPYELKVTVNPKAKLTNSPTSFEIYSGETFTFNAENNMSVGDVEFKWERVAVDGISNLPASGNSGNIAEALHNTTGETKDVTYMITLKTDKCESIENVKVSVKPKIGLSSDLNPSPICSGEEFDYLATCDISGVKFSWTREAVDGINGNTSGSGNSHIVKETLQNAKDIPLTVTYRFKLEVGTSVNYEDVKVIVKPKPTLSSSKTPPGICSGYELSYTATTATQLGQIIGWKREAVSGISNARAEESGAVITETLINTTSSPVEITYIFLLEADGCTNQEEVKVLVTTQPVITVKNATENEGDDLVFEVTLSGAACAGGNPTVDFTTFDGTAVAPDDYTAVSGTLIFTPGETTKTAIVKTNADNIIEGRETMRLRLSSPAYCQLSGGNLTLDATGTIEDRTDGTIIVEKYKPDGDIQAAEPSTDGSFLIRFKNTNVTCTDEVKVEFSLSGADPGIDYVIETSSIVSYNGATIKPGQNGVVIPVKIINNYLVQGSRSLTLTLTNVRIVRYN